MNAAVDFTAKQARGFEDAEMFGDGGERDVEGSGEFGDSGFALGKTCEDGAAGGVGEGAENGVEQRGRCGRDLGRIVNHMV
jgi:hypothetical protein